MGYVLWFLTSPVISAVPGYSPLEVVLLVVHEMGKNGVMPPALVHCMDFKGDMMSEEGGVIRLHHQAAPPLPI